MYYMTQNTKDIHRGDIFTADLGKRCGAVESGIRPVLVIQSDDVNRKGHTVVLYTKFCTRKMVSKKTPWFFASKLPR